MLARTACRTRAAGSCLRSVANNASTDGRTRSTIERRFPDWQVAKALIENDLRWHPRVGTAENDGERLLTCRQLVAARLARERVRVANVSDEATVSLSQAFECFPR